jgi:hypothetical protein
MSTRSYDTAALKPAPYTDRYVSAGGLNLHVQDYGTAGKPQMLCVHGSAAHAHWFDFVASGLNDEYHVLAPDQRGHGSRDFPKCGKLPRTGVGGVDHLNPIRPWSDVEAAGLTEVEEHRPGIVQQGEDPQRAVGGDQVEIGHAASEQRVALAELVVDVEARHHPGVAPARLVHAEEL